MGGFGDARTGGGGGDWLNAQLRAPSGYYGGFYGFEPNPLKLTWQSTEQNTDLYAVFSKLGRAQDAAHAGGFVQAMFSGGVFGAGLGPDGARNEMLAADAGTWPYLAGLGSAQSARAAVENLRQGKGIGFSDASRSMWLEGTAFAALALGRDPLARVFLNTVGANRVAARLCVCDRRADAAHGADGGAFVAAGRAGAGVQLLPATGVEHHVLGGFGGFGCQSVRLDLGPNSSGCLRQDEGFVR